MRCKAPDKQFYRELTDLNEEFLMLVATAGAGASFLGLDAPIRSALGELSRPKLQFIAETPCLLAGFTLLPPALAAREEPPGFSVMESAWMDSARMFSAALLTYLWQMARRNQLNAALCIGASADHIGRFAGISFHDIQSRAASAVYQLEARFCHQPRFWRDLIRAAHHGNSIVQRISRLTSIPLALADQRPL